MAIAALFSTGIAFIVAWAIARRRYFVGRGELALLMIAIGIWSLLIAIHAWLTSTPQQIIVAKLQHTVIQSVPLLWLLVVRQISGYARLAWPHLALLLIMPLLSVGLVWTNEQHGLIWHAIEPVGGTLIYQQGTWFWLSVAYNYMLMIIALIMLIRNLTRTPSAFRPQLYTLLLASLLPWVGNLIHLMRVSPIPNYDPTPLSFALSGLIVFWALTRQRLFDLVPIARSTLIEQTHNGILVLDQQQRIVDYNPAALHIIGLNADHIGQPLVAALPILAAAVQESIDTGATGTVEQVGQQAECVEVRATTLVGRADRPIGWLVVLRDISVQYGLMRQLRAENSFVFQVMETMDEGLYVTDEQGMFSFVNAAYARMFGYTSEELIGLSPLDLAPKSEHINIRRMWLERRIGRSSSYRSFLRRSDDVIVPVQITAAPRFVDDAFAGSVAVITDLSERLAQEAALRTAEATLRSFFDHVGVMMGIAELYDNDILFVSGNAVVSTFFGVPVEALEGRRLSTLGMSQAIIQRWLTAYQTSEESGQPVEFDYVYEHADGPRWLAATVSCIGLAPDGTMRYAYVINDITARKLLEKQLIGTQEQLEAVNRQLQELAHTDGLTGLANRSAFDKRLREELARATRYDLPLSLLLIDVDYFKLFNDTYGHVAGDDVLRSVAQLFQQQSRQHDLAARYGGEEFAIILPNTNADEALHVAERVRLSIAEKALPKRSITISIGVTTVMPPQGPDQLISYADAALYSAKALGRNRVIHSREIQAQQLVMPEQ